MITQTTSTKNEVMESRDHSEKNGVSPKDQTSRRKNKSALTDIPSPNNNEVQRYLEEWDKLTNYVLQESSITKLFQKTYPKNDVMDDVLIKVCALNDFYSTNIFSPYSVAQHIIDLHIDNRLEQGDVTLVNEIADIEIQGRKKRFYSFATKYCSNHRPLDFPIYDYYVQKVLQHFRNVSDFHVFRKDDLKDYPVFKDVLLKFRIYYHLEQYNLKELDRYLWLLGKEYFPRRIYNNSATDSF